MRKPSLDQRHSWIPSVIKEARLSLAHVNGAKQPVFGATLGEPKSRKTHVELCH